MKLKCYHGTTRKNASSILSEGKFRPSEKEEGLRLGRGAYFYNKTAWSDYAKQCAYDTVAYHHDHCKNKEEYPDYAILSCDVECDDSQFFDMYTPEGMELFHEARKKTYQTMVANGHSFTRCGALDTQTMDILRESMDIAVIRCPQFFGFMRSEESIRFTERTRPLTYVPNVIIVCVDPSKAIISNIQIEEEGCFYD